MPTLAAISNLGKDLFEFRLKQIVGIYGIDAYNTIEKHYDGLIRVLCSTSQAILNQALCIPSFTISDENKQLIKELSLIKTKIKQEHELYNKIKLADSLAKTINKLIENCPSLCPRG